jgi:hypothetical protein
MLVGIQLTWTLWTSSPSRHRGLPVGYRRAYIGFQGGDRKETGILTEVDTYDWITLLHMNDGGNSSVFTGKNRAFSWQLLDARTSYDLRRHTDKVRGWHLVLVHSASDRMVM